MYNMWEVVGASLRSGAKRSGPAHGTGLPACSRGGGALAPALTHESELGVSSHRSGVGNLVEGSRKYTLSRQMLNRIITVHSRSCVLQWSYQVGQQPAARTTSQEDDMSTAHDARRPVARSNQDWITADREESEDCERLTPGCSVNHTASPEHRNCETW